MFKDGTSIAGIRLALSFDIEVSTLQRRLERLHQQGEVVANGKPRALVYALKEKLKLQTVKDNGRAIGSGQLSTF